MGARQDAADRLRALPSVDRLATSVARAVVEERRAELLAGASDDAVSALGNVLLDSIALRLRIDEEDLRNLAL